MNKNLQTLVISIITLIIFPLISQAQLHPGNFGIGAQFAGSTPYATVHYAIATNMDISLALLYSSETYSSDQYDDTGDAQTTLGFQGIFKYFLNKGKDVSPFVGGYLNYIAYPTIEGGTYKDTRSLLGIAAIFGGQVFLAKGFAVYAYAALGYSSETSKRDYTGGTPDETTTITAISLAGSSVGAVFYLR